uniref:Uncharacterized protein n=1 Tax=Parascaris equorum TaxID=6256 RepID=A0A914RW70_PAREQ
MFSLTNTKRHNQLGVLGRFTPSPSFNVIYRRTVERNIMRNNLSEKALADMHANCFLLVPLMPLCRSVNVSNSRIGLSSSDRQIVIHPSQ